MPLHSPVFPGTTDKDGSSFTTTPSYSDNVTQTQKPYLTKYQAIDVEDDGRSIGILLSKIYQLILQLFPGKKLSRGISRTAENVGIISQFCDKMSASLTEVDESSLPNNQTNTLETNECTFTLPDLSSLSGKEINNFIDI